MIEIGKCGMKISEKKTSVSSELKPLLGHLFRRLFGPKIYVLKFKDGSLGQESFTTYEECKEYRDHQFNGRWNSLETYSWWTRGIPVDIVKMVVA